MLVFLAGFASFDGVCDIFGNAWSEDWGSSSVKAFLLPQVPLVYGAKYLLSKGGWYDDTLSLQNETIFDSQFLAEIWELNETYLGLEVEVWLEFYQIITAAGITWDMCMRIADQY